jgi:hypothetical protein
MMNLARINAGSGMLILRRINALRTFWTHFSGTFLFVADGTGNFVSNSAPCLAAGGIEYTGKVYLLTANICTFSGKSVRT